MKRDPRELLAIFTGGALGALARVGLSRLWPAGDGAFPWAIFAANISGALLLGYLVTRLEERLPLSTYRRQFMATGFCGAYTTFSTMQLGLLHMVDAGRYVTAIVYLTLSIVCGYTAVYTSTALTRRVRVSS